MNQPTLHDIDTVVRHWALRAVAAVGLTSIAVIHLLDSIGKFTETPYMFWMYVALMIGSLATAGALLLHRSRLAFAAAGGLAASALMGYILSRTTGLPNATGDIGNWTEPLGLASMMVEGAVVAVAAVGWKVSDRAGAALAIDDKREPRRLGLAA